MLSWLLNKVDALATAVKGLGNETDPASVLVPKLLQKAQGISGKLDNRDMLLKSLAS